MSRPTHYEVIARGVRGDTYCVLRTSSRQDAMELWSRINARLPHLGG